MGYVGQSTYSPQCTAVAKGQTSPQQAISDHFGACGCGDQYVHAQDFESPRERADPAG